LKKLLKRLEVDRAVFFGLLTRIWQMLAVPVAALLIASQFTPELQGYYYTFESLVRLQVLVELGLGTVIIQFASHEWSKLGLDKTGQIVGDKDALSRLVSLAHVAVRWYLVGAILLILGLGVGGYMFFPKPSGNAINWVAPWFLLCLLTGVTICLLPIWSLLEGCNQVSNVYFYRFMQSLCTYSSLWLAILLGAKLWTASIYSAVGLVCAFIYLLKKYKLFLKTLLFSHETGPTIGWRSEIWPMQWRIAISWASGYFIYWLFTPILFHYHGPVVAGQMGMTWAMIGGLSAVVSSWILPKAPHFGILIANKEYQELDKLCWRLTKITLGVACLGALVIWSIVFALYTFGHPLALRLLPPLPTGFFLLATISLVALIPMSVYLRAHKKEPLVFISVISAIFVAASNLVLGKYYSATGMATGYLLINLIMVPVVIVIWRRCRNKWH